MLPTSSGEQVTKGPVFRALIAASNTSGVKGNFPVNSSLRMRNE
jgi:hypothetical protein